MSAPLSKQEQIVEIDGLRTTVVGSAAPQSALIVLLHGFGMTAADLAPFAHSLGLPALFLFPEAPLPGYPAGRSWFELDMEARRTAQLAGPRDLATRVPANLGVASERLDSYLQASRIRFQPQRLILGGFSQGGMLSCEWLLHHTAAIDALMLLSASRLNAAAWATRRERLRGLPTLISHGKRDTDLAYSAGVALRDFVGAAGGQVTWVPFDGGHEIPLVVWRAIRKFLLPFTVT